MSELNDLLKDPARFAQAIVRKGEAWADAEAAAALLEETRKTVLASEMAKQGDMPVSKAEMHALASDVYRLYQQLRDGDSKAANTLRAYASGGIATSLNAQTGKIIKQARLTGALEDYYASPIGVDGKVYIASEHGKVVVLRAAGDWEILAVNDFDSEIGRAHV